MTLVNLPRVDLGIFPTPLQKLSNLSHFLEGPHIWAKREDLSGLGAGGNKTRIIEYILADVKKNGADTVLGSLGTQSNFNLQLASAAHKLNMNTGFVLYGDEHPQIQGNLLLLRILNSKIKILKGDRTYGEYVRNVDKELRRMAEEFSGAGHNPVIIKDGDPHYDILGVMGWVSGAEELFYQLQAQKINAQYLVVTVASATTLAGITLGLKLLGSSIRVIGISSNKSRDKAVQEAVHRANAAATFMDWDVKLVNDEMVTYDDYTSTKHDATTKECLKAMQLVAQKEGIFLDPIYSGKGMAGLIDLVRKGKFKPEDTVIFLHGGGFPAIFAYDREIIDYYEDNS